MTANGSQAVALEPPQTRDALRAILNDIRDKVDACLESLDEGKPPMSLFHQTAKTIQQHGVELEAAVVLQSRLSGRGIKRNGRPDRRFRKNREITQKKIDMRCSKFSGAGA